MFSVETENIGGATVVHCEGSLTQADAVSKVRDAVTRQSDARIVLLDLSEITKAGSGAIGLLAALQEWTREHGVQFHLFDPPDFIQKSLAKTSLDLDVASMPEVLALLDWDELSDRWDDHGRAPVGSDGEHCRRHGGVPVLALRPGFDDHRRAPCRGRRSGHRVTRPNHHIP